MYKPAFGVPYGKKDAEKGWKDKFLIEEVLPLLSDMNALLYLQIQGEPDLDSWLGPVIDTYTSYGARFAWHVPIQTLVGLAKMGMNLPTVEPMIAKGKRLISTGLFDSITGHLDPSIRLENVGKDAGMERYASVFDADYLINHISSQTAPLHEINKALNLLFSYEVNGLTNFVKQGFRLPTYLEVQTGAWLDARWIANETSCSVVVDNAHVQFTMNFLYRMRHYQELPVWEPEYSASQMQLYAMTGYWLDKGEFPFTDMKKGGLPFSVIDYIQLLAPNVKTLQLDAAIQEDLDGTLGTHLPYLRESGQDKERLLPLLELIRQGVVNNVVVVPVGLDINREAYDPWSPRIESTDEAQRESLLAVIETYKELLAS